jgi:hypothetical protein
MYAVNYHLEKVILTEELALLERSNLNISTYKISLL